MDLIKIYKQNEILKDYVNIYVDDEKESLHQGNVKYKILHIIGNGVYGVVYKAFCLSSLCVVALKQTYQKNARIFKEVEIMKKLRHPNIVKLKHAFYTNTSNGGVYVHMIMEYGNTDLATSLYYISIQNSPEHVNTFYESTGNQEGFPQNGNAAIFGDDCLEEANFAYGGDNMEGPLHGNPNRLATAELDSPRGGSGVLKNAVSNFNINALQESISHICPCHNISEYIKKSFLNENQIKIYLYQLIRATLYLHTLCITHRDIKPQNVLIFVNKQGSNNGAGGEKKKKKCLVCIQNSFKVKYIMNRRRRGGEAQEAQEAGDVVLGQAASEGDAAPNGRNQSESPGRKPSRGDSPNFASNAKEEDSQNEGGPSEGERREETHSGDHPPWKETPPCGTSKRRAQGCHSRYSRSSTPISFKCVVNRLGKKDVRLKRSATMTQSFKESADVCRDNPDMCGDTPDSCEASSKENCASPSANKLGSHSRGDKLDGQMGSPSWCTKKSAVEDGDRDKGGCDGSEKGGVEPPRDGSSSISSTEGDLMPCFEVNPAHGEGKISLDRIYMNTITYKYIKLCDFNTSIKLKENYKYFSYVCSRYYRAPELLFGSNYYSQAIDTWSIGCVMGELILGKPLFLGDCASDQLVEIIKILGTPNDEDFLSFKSGHKNVKLPQVKPITLKKLIKNQSSQESIDLLGKLLQFNPQKRIKLCNALLHTYFDDIRNLNAFKNDHRNGGGTFPLPYITNCFNFTKEELLHFTVEERKILVPLEVRRRKLDEVMQYIDMPLESFDQMYPNKVHLAC